MRIDAEAVQYRDLNARIASALDSGEGPVSIVNVRGQRYIGAGLDSSARIEIEGVPGNDLGAFMNGARIVVHGNAQDGIGNTMNAGCIVVHGDVGDILGYSMRGGRVFVRGSVGYRAGIHMKAYRSRVPAVVIGGTAGDYLGEYMAGGVLVVLGLGSEGSSPVGSWVGTGMHGGVMYLRGEAEPWQLGAEVGVSALDENDWDVLEDLLWDFSREFGIADFELEPARFRKLYPQTSRPYGALYAY